MTIPASQNDLVSIALIQMAMERDADKNLERAVQFIDEAAQQGAQIVCLPELFRSPYFPQIEDAGYEYAEPLDGRTQRALADAARRNRIVLVGGSIYEDAGSERFNTALVFDPNGDLLGKYRKLHIPHDPGFYEKNYFAPGDLGYQVFDTPYGKIAVLICFDQWFPEAARSVALMGAEIVFYPTAIGEVKGVEQKEGHWQSAWEGVQRGHAIANNMIVAAVNRVGEEGETTFWGGSFVSDAFGTVLARGARDERIILCQVNRQHSRFTRDGWRFFPNRRIDTYGKLLGQVEPLL